MRQIWCQLLNAEDYDGAVDGYSCNHRVFEPSDLGIGNAILISVELGVDTGIVESVDI